MKYEEKSAVVTRPTGEVHSGANERHDSPVQPMPDDKGAPASRQRKEAPETLGRKVTQPKAASDMKHDVIKLGRNLAKHSADATHIHADNPSAKNREAFVKDQRTAKDDRFESPSGRTPLKAMIRKSSK